MTPLDAACPMKPPKTGPKIGPQNAAFANTGKTAVLSEAVHMSEILPPAQTNGVAPNRPARKRNASWAPMFGAYAVVSLSKYQNIHRRNGGCVTYQARGHDKDHEECHRCEVDRIASHSFRNRSREECTREVCQCFVLDSPGKMLCLPTTKSNKIYTRRERLCDFTHTELDPGLLDDGRIDA